jgi:hypothetical protein
MLSALIHYSVATQHCLVRQLVHQRLRRYVPLVLVAASPQLIDNSNR